MSDHSAISRLRRPIVASVAAVCLAAGSASPALAQDSLPDPNKQDSAKSSATTKTAQNTSDLPTTGIETSWLTLAGVALLAAGVAVQPAARRRRSYRTETWEHVVRSGS